MKYLKCVMVNARQISAHIAVTVACGTVWADVTRSWMRNKVAYYGSITDPYFGIK